jgi:isopentenyl diphosphate isomerase/L-lactate dehydrogenase-like FMN-dependent dehydrogenase
MSGTAHDQEGRRRFLRYLAASPLFATAGLAQKSLARLFEVRADEATRGRDPAFGAGGVLREMQQLQQDTLIQSPDQALSVLDFEPVARVRLPAAHFGYMASGVDDDATLRANRQGFTHFQLRPRRLVDVRQVDPAVSIFSERWETPIVICPCGSQKAFHPDGELATARAARAKNHLQILSGVSTTSVEDVNAARGRPVWYQLYPTNDEHVAQAIARRAAKAGCPVLILTVDLNAGRNLESQVRDARLDSRNCADCHGVSVAASVKRKPMFDGLDLSRASDFGDPSMTWDYVKRMRDAVPGMKLVVKGIVTREDAALAAAHGVDAIVVSNHGGRAEESLRSTIESLPEVLQGAAGRIPVLVDSGFRRGTDVMKAMALGATAVGFGRPYLWGLAAFGQPGVEMVLTILRRETELAMRQMGAPSFAKLARSQVVEVGTPLRPSGQR